MKLASLNLYTHEKSTRIINKRLRVNAIKEIKHLFKQSLISMYVYILMYTKINICTCIYLYQHR